MGNVPERRQCYAEYRENAVRSTCAPVGDAAAGDHSTIVDAHAGPARC